jgi:hypothetical protein
VTSDSEGSRGADGRAEEGGGAGAHQMPGTASEALREGARLGCGALFGRLLTVQALVPLLFGGVLLSAAWQLASLELSRRTLERELHGRTSGVVEPLWWRLDFDPSRLGDATNWRALTDPEVCALLRFAPSGAGEVTSFYCRRFDRYETAYLFSEAGVLGTGVPARWLDADGMPRFEVRLSQRAADWLAAHPAAVDPFVALAGDAETPDTLGQAPPSAGARWLGGDWQHLDDPFFHMLQQWSRRPREITVAFDPERPTRAVPLAALRDGTLGDPDGVAVMALAPALGVLGGIFWLFGARFLALGVFGGRRARLLGTVVAVGSLALVPLLGASVGKLLTSLWSDAERAVIFLRQEMIGLPPMLELRESASPGAPGDLALEWTLAGSRFAPMLERMPLAPPAAGDTDAVLRDLSRQVKERLAALPDEGAREALETARRLQEAGEGAEVGLLFIEGALALLEDPRRDGTVHAEAEALLGALRWRPPSRNPDRGAAAERRRLLALLP